MSNSEKGKIEIIPGLKKDQNAGSFYSPSYLPT
jgi:hypothetical protein